GIYVVTVTGTAGTITKNINLNFVVQTGTAPGISTQPAPTQVLCSGDDATFSVTSPGAISYQWYVSTDGGSTFTEIAGGNSATYTLNSVTTAQQSNQYKVLVSGQCNSVFSDVATITVQEPPSISQHPQNVTLCTGSNNTFSVTAGGTGLTYQWQLSTDGGATFTDIPGAVSSTFTVNSLTGGMNGHRYRVNIGGTCAPGVTSNAATLTVISPVTITDQPDDITICETGNVSFTVAGSGANVNYQWQISTDGGTSYTNIAGAITNTLAVNSVTAGMDGNLYRALLWNPTCTTPVPSDGAELTVNARPTVTLTAAPSATLLPGQ